jgi:hypothetical protein
MPWALACPHQPCRPVYSPVSGRRRGAGRGGGGATARRHRARAASACRGWLCQRVAHCSARLRGAGGALADQIGAAAGKQGPARLRCDGARRIRAATSASADRGAAPPPAPCMGLDVHVAVHLRQTSTPAHGCLPACLPLQWMAVSGPSYSTGSEGSCPKCRARARTSGGRGGPASAALAGAPGAAAACCCPALPRLPTRPPLPPLSQDAMDTDAPHNGHPHAAAQHQQRHRHQG